MILERPGYSLPLHINISLHCYINWACG